MNPVFYEQRPESLFIGAICDHPYPPHVHDPVEIVCLTAGEIEMLIGQERFCLRAGDIAAAFPAVPHAYLSVSPDAEGLSLIFVPNTIQEFSQTFRAMQPVCPLLQASAAAPELTGIIQSLRDISAREESALRLGYLHVFISHLFTCLSLQPRCIRAHDSLSCQALEYISQHFTEPLTLESTARALGISPIHLSHLFSQQLKTNFRQYLNALRISLACSLLTNPAHSITQIAYMCGFGNSRTFHRAFQAQCHMQPNQYRARHTLG